MVKKKTIKLILKIVLYWCIAMLFASLFISIFSCFVPAEKFDTYMEYYGFTISSLVFFKLTVEFFLFISFLIAAPGFISNVLIYFLRKKEGKYFSNKVISIVINVTLGLFILYFFQRLNISRKTDFLYIILPGYIVSMMIWGILILPGRIKRNNSCFSEIDTTTKKEELE